MSVSPRRHPAHIFGKAQQPRDPPVSLVSQFCPFPACSRVVAPASDSSRRSPWSTNRPPTASLERLGDRIEHPQLKPFTQFGPESEDYRRAVVIHNKPRYPPEVAIIRLFREEQASLADELETKAEPKAAPPSPRYPLPFPNASLVGAPGSASSVFSLMRFQKQETRSHCSSTTSPNRAESCSGVPESIPENADPSGSGCVLSMSTIRGSPQRDGSSTLSQSPTQSLFPPIGSAGAECRGGISPLKRPAAGKTPSRHLVCTFKDDMTRAVASNQ